MTHETTTFATNSQSQSSHKFNDDNDIKTNMTYLLMVLNINNNKFKLRRWKIFITSGANGSSDGMWQLGDDTRNPASTG